MLKKNKGGKSGMNFALLNYFERYLKCKRTSFETKETEWKDGKDITLKKYQEQDVEISVISLCRLSNQILKTLIRK